MKNRAIALVVAAILFFTFSAPPSAHAVVPAAGVVIWGIFVGIAAIVVGTNESEKTEEENKKADVQEQNEDSTISPTAMKVQESAG